MKPLINCPVPVQNTVCFWALLSCFFCMAVFMLLMRQKRKSAAAGAAAGFLLSYLIMHVCREGTVLRLYGKDEPVPAALLRIPAAVFAVLLLAVTFYCAFYYINILKWRRNNITTTTIKESLDGLPAGLCYYLPDGRCLLVNHRMNDICRSLFGRDLQDGSLLCGYVKDDPVQSLPDGTAVSFRHRELVYEGSPLHEIIADDITELYQKTEELRLDNERARQLSAGMKAYGNTITDTVRRQEILQAKMNIHDEMNRMILQTKTLLHSGGEAERIRILRMWQGPALLLAKEADTGKSSNVVSDLTELASVLGMRIEWDGKPETEDSAQLSLFLLAAREALANAYKHGRAETMYISVRESDKYLSAVFTNDGIRPESYIGEKGGLVNLRNRIEAAGGSMKTEAAPEFRLSVSIPEGGEDNAL
ncbi:MAG: hypothetical protein IKR93_07830 [Firmicutes bacterium]|nr:hypothetical protein [Bacillota bacterium]